MTTHPKKMIIGITKDRIFEGFITVTSMKSARARVKQLPKGYRIYGRIINH